MSGAPANGPPQSGDCDVIVIGAGAAGLIAAGELIEAGQRVTLLEARDRIGGRIWTRREPGIAVPIELGAEFVHGHAPLTEGLLTAAGATVIEAADSHFALERGALKARRGFFRRSAQPCNARKRRSRGRTCPSMPSSSNSRR